MGMEASVPAGLAAAQAVADAILYEGYLLYPYRRSSGKNRVRWQFGVLTPRAWTEARGPVDTGVAGSAESWWQRTECLLEASGDATVHCQVRFLQLQHRSVEERSEDGSYRPVDRIEAGPRTALSFDEAVPRTFDADFSLRDLLTAERHHILRAPAGEETEPLTAVRPVGRVRRRRWPVSVSLTASAVHAETRFRSFRLRLRIENLTETVAPDAARDEALRSSPLACHLLLAVRGGEFVSLLEPAPWAEEASRACVNQHTFPVLAGDPGSRDVVLSAPILLYDHPRVAPESPGDLHDATEIDEILSLRTSTLTEAEKREARATDARAAEIIDRVDGMPEEVLSRLHGTIRSFRPVPVPPEQEAPAADAGWWDPGAGSPVSPETGSVVVAGTPVAKGSRVRLWPRRGGTDPQDAFLEGRTAQVEAVLVDVDDACHLAVTVEDDPAAEINRWYGRYRYFSPAEVEPLVSGEERGA